MRGFSLVELSIVLVVLGLLTGGILAGQSLIRAAELRSVGTQFQQFSAALHTFRDKYRAIPGDFRDATKFWFRGASTSDCATNSSAAVGSPGACDGNGTNTLSDTTAGLSGEKFQFWRHLALAGLIEGSYSGYAGTGGNDHSTAGVNVPGGKLSNSGWYATSSGGYGYTNIDQGNYWVFGSANSNNAYSSSLLKPEEAWNIDVKMDDGKPAYGRIGIRLPANGCAVSDDGSAASASNPAASYNVSNTSTLCTFHFMRVW